MRPNPERIIRGLLGVKPIGPLHRTSGNTERPIETKWADHVKEKDIDILGIYLGVKFGGEHSSRVRADPAPSASSADVPFRATDGYTGKTGLDPQVPRYHILYYRNLKGPVIFLSEMNARHATIAD